MYNGTHRHTDTDTDTHTDTHRHTDTHTHTHTHTRTLVRLQRVGEVREEFELHKGRYPVVTCLAGTTDG